MFAVNLPVVFFALSCVTLAWDSPTQTGRPRITGIDHLTIYVSDVEKSRRFYSHVLGFTTGCPQYSRSETCFLVSPSEQRILLKVVSTEIRVDVHKSWLGEIAFATDDVRDAREYLLTHGFHPGPIQEDSDGAQSIRVRDPEGNSIAFVRRSPSKVGHAPSSKQISSRLIHAGFVVKDFAAENRFYVDLLGFRLYWQGGFKDDGTDWYELQVPDGPDWIEYMLNIPANADHKELGVQNHFSFGVKDVQAAAAELRSRGYETFDGPEIGRDGKDSLDAYDPDGTRVEIMEFTPVQKPCCHPYTADHPKP
jgi:catechol 2,3-dioxygenase-like lactoylglutathione lyase family enzyme